MSSRAPEAPIESSCSAGFSRTVVAATLVALYRALGGGWESMPGLGVAAAGG